RNALDVPDARDYTRRRNLSPLIVHFVSRPQADLEEWRFFIKQATEPFPHRESVHLSLAFVARLATTLAQDSLLLCDRGAVSAHQFIGRGRKKHDAKPLTRKCD